MPWSAVQSIKTDEPVTVELPGDVKAVGKLQTQGDTLQVVGAAETRSAPLAQVGGVRNPAEQRSRERLQHPGMLELWTGYFDIGPGAGARQCPHRHHDHQFQRHPRHPTRQDQRLLQPDLWDGAREQHRQRHRQRAAGRLVLQPRHPRHGCSPASSTSTNTTSSRSSICASSPAAALGTTRSRTPAPRWP